MSFSQKSPTQPSADPEMRHKRTCKTMNRAIYYVITDYNCGQEKR
jgi:hypothetical protein